MLLMKIGGGSDETCNFSAIHWHTQSSNEVTYISKDSSREVISWLHLKTKDGREEIFVSRDFNLPEEELRKGVERKMERIDCHNRPSHIYHAPAYSINHLMASNWIDPKLPYIKSMSMEALERPYSKKENALDSIRVIIEQFYAANFPDVMHKQKNGIQTAVSQVQNIYRRNYFPGNQVSWRKYPDHIAHMYWLVVSDVTMINMFQRKEE